MRFRGIGCRAMLALAMVCVMLVGSAAMAQDDPVDPPADGDGDVIVNPPVAGIAVDAEGVLRTQTLVDPGGRLARERITAAKASLDPKLTAFSPMRMISLSRLEKAIRQRQGVATDEMRNLAGLQRVRYVFCYPDSGDVVIGGPAEGWVTNPTGRVVGITSGRPVVQLQDLVVALRAYPPGTSGAGIIGCSIDPTQEGLAAMQQFLRSIGSRATPGDTQYIVTGLRTSLGLQQVSINGVSPKTHFAQVMVEADYRMKLIGIGLERPPVRLVSYVDRANPAQVSRNAMQRWFFTPDYQCVRVSEDRLAMELVGDGVKLVGEDEMVTADGQRKTAARGNRASQTFVASFTKHYKALADRSPVYAQLRNLIDLAVAAAFIQQENYYDQTGWEMGLFGDEQAFAVETYPAPKMVETAVNAVWEGRRLMTPVGGGVSIQATQALQSENLLPDKNGKVAELREKTKIKLAEGQWWWD
ncbi:MAG: hypothetical protein A2V70_02180 [Planctomycetes bacterium RBG_13_63_9]|nr:MAG: hypothetical protein A2V70_02180 [Planctomycetes bacterium RBG_13_63_9]